MNVHHDAKTVDIWLTRSEARDDNFRKSLEPYYQQFKEKKYFVSVFESGERDLFSDTVLLRRHNLELHIKAELAAEQVYRNKICACRYRPCRTSCCDGKGAFRISLLRYTEDYKDFLL